MIAVDKSVLRKDYRDAEVDPMLVNFADLVGFAKPCCNFVVDDQCVKRLWKTNEDNSHTEHLVITKFRVFENGEELGDICVDTRYSNQGGESVYKVRSFRIQKERGDRNGTTAKDIKVALRHAKKALISREASELVEQVRNQVSNKLEYLHQSGKHHLQWSMDSGELVMQYALAAYEARNSGKPTVELGSNVAIPSLKNHDDCCAKFVELNSVFRAMKDKKGYGIHERVDKSLIVYSFAADSVKRYDDFESLPIEIQNKYAMFKVLEKEEANANIGCKFDEGYSYVVE